MMGNALVAFGANLGNTEETYSEVIARLHGSHGIGVMGAGRLFDTTPIGGPPDLPPFKNGAILLDVSISPAEVLSTLRQIEHSLGRVRSEQWGSRNVDLDLLLYEHFGEDGLHESVCISTETLTLPHPRMHFRRFVLEPAMQVAPDMVHPVFGFTLEELLAHLDREPRVVAIAGDNLERVSEVARGIADRAGTRLVDRSVSPAGNAHEEYVTVLTKIEPLAPPAQLLIWLSRGESGKPIPEELLGQLKANRFSTWLSLPASHLEAAIVEGAAAVAAMRPFAAE